MYYMTLKVNDNSSLATFNSLVGIVQGAEDIFSSNVLIKSQIFFGLVGAVKKEYGILGPK